MTHWVVPAALGVMVCAGKPSGVTDREWQAFILRHRDRVPLRDIGARYGISAERTRQLSEKVYRRCVRRMAAPVKGGTHGTAP